MKEEVVKFPFYLQNNAKNKAKKAGGNVLRQESAKILQPMGHRYAKP